MSVVKDSLYVEPNRAKIKKIMDKCGLTRPEIAEAVGCSESSVYRLGWPSVSGRMRLDIIENIADLLGVGVKGLYDPKTVVAGTKLIQRNLAKAPSHQKARKELKDVRDSPVRKEPVYEEVYEALEGMGKAYDALRSTLAKEARASERYRELVGQFSLKALSHQEALKVLRELIEKANNWDKWTNKSIGDLIAMGS